MTLRKVCRQREHLLIINLLHRLRMLELDKLGCQAESVELVIFLRLPFVQTSWPSQFDKREVGCLQRGDQIERLSQTPIHEASSTHIRTTEGILFNLWSSCFPAANDLMGTF